MESVRVMNVVVDRARIVWCWGAGKGYLAFVVDRKGTI